MSQEDPRAVAGKVDPIFVPRLLDHETAGGRSRAVRKDGHNSRDVFDRFADGVERHVSSAPFFTACVLLVVLWGPSYWVLGSVNTWELIINTVTTIVTFLLLALLQNTQARFADSVNARLRAIMADLDVTDPVLDPGQAGVDLEERGLDAPTPVESAGSDGPG